MPNEQNQTPLRKIGWPTKEQIEKHFNAWKQDGKLGLLKTIQENPKV